MIERGRLTRRDLRALGTRQRRRPSRSTGHGFTEQVPDPHLPPEGARRRPKIRHPGRSDPQADTRSRSRPFVVPIVHPATVLPDPLRPLALPLSALYGGVLAARDGWERLG